jgi:IclR family acetate operon transcriptional repressor
VLAFVGPALLDRLLGQPLAALTAKTVTDPAQLRDMIREIREKGFSQLDSTFDEEVASLGAPLFGPSGQVLGAISVAVPVGRFTPARLREIAPKLQEAARAASLSLGGRPVDIVQRMGQTG